MFRFLVSMCSTCVLLLIGSSAAADHPFSRELVDDDAPAGQWPSLQLDATGQPRIAYAAGPNGFDLKFAFKSGHLWTIEEVDTAGYMGAFASLELDSQGNAHVAYLDLNNDDIRYAKRSSNGAWTVATVVSSGDPTELRLVLDSADRPRIAWIDRQFSTHDVLYKAHNGTSWQQTEVVKAGIHEGSNTSIGFSIDSQDVPHVAYALPSGEVIYASKTSGWTTASALAATSAYALELALTHDANDHPRLAIGRENTLLYAANTGSGWTSSSIASYATSVRTPSIAVTSTGLARIAFGAAGMARLASWTGSSWEVHEVDDPNLSSAGFWTSLTLDAQDNPLVAYYRQDGANNLYFADGGIRLYEPNGGETYFVGTSIPLRWGGAGTVNIYASEDQGVTWTYEGQATGSVAHNQISLTLSPSYDSAHMRLRLDRTTPAASAASASNFTHLPLSNRNWLVENLDSGSATGSNSSLVVIGSEAGVAYRDPVNDDLRFAKNPLWSWGSTVVDAGGGTGPSSASHGNDVHVSYTVGTTLRHAVWTQGWASEDVATLGSSGYTTRIAVDAGGQPHILYGGGLSLTLASKSTSWSFDTIESSALIGPFAIRLDSSGHPHVAYFKWGVGLVYATNSGSGWSYSYPQSGFIYGCSIALDSQDRPTIGYVNSPAAGTYEVKTVQHNGSSWGSPQTLALSSELILYVSMAINSNDQSFVVFEMNGLLRCLGPGTGGVGQSIIAIEDANFVSLALNEAGVPHVAYQTAPSGPLRFAASDDVVPGQVTNLSVGVGRYNVALSWAAPGDDGSVGRGAAYDVRYSTAPINASNFAQAISVEAGMPFKSGETECLEIDGLNQCTTYYFAIKTIDEAGNISSISNLPNGKTHCSGYMLATCSWGAAARPVGREDPALTLALRLPQPNPASGQVWLPFVIPQRTSKEAVTLTVFDLAGRRVRQLLSDDTLAGTHTSVWDLKSDRGLRVAPGLYFVTLKFGNEGITRSVVVR